MKLNFKLILFVSLFISMTFCVFEKQAERPESCAQYLHAISRHENQGALFEVFQNGQKVETADEQGIHILVIDSELNQVQKQGNWDIKSMGDSDMIKFIGDIKDNQIVVVGVHTDASQNLSSNGYKALQSVGFTALKQLEENEVFVLIGKKGNSEEINISFDNNDFAMQNFCLQECGNLCQGCAEGQPNVCTSCFELPGFLKMNSNPPDCQPKNSKYERVANNLVASGKEMLKKVSKAFKKGGQSSLTIDQVVGSMQMMM